MIHLGDCHTNIQVVADQWELRLRDFLFRKNKKKLRIEREGKVISFDTYYEKMEGKVRLCNELNEKEKEIVLEELNYFNRSFRKIVLAGENELHDFSMEQSSELMKDLMKSLYEDFTQKLDANGISNAHFFFRELNIRTCPYCNRHYTFTLDEKVKVAPEFDHFYDKSKHPLLAVSFYNLVPSCHTCNHAKGTKRAIINPYFSGFRRKFEIQDNQGKRMPLDEIISQKKGGKVGFGKLGDSDADKKRLDDEQENVNTFGLQGLYEMHDDYINEIVEKTIAYNPTARQALAYAFQDQAYSPQQVYDFVWGKYLQEAQYGRKPLSKLTKDILEQLGIYPDNNSQ